MEELIVGVAFLGWALLDVAIVHFGLFGLAEVRGRSQVGDVARGFLAQQKGVYVAALVVLHLTQDRLVDVRLFSILLGRRGGVGCSLEYVSRVAMGQLSEALSQT